MLLRVLHIVFLCIGFNTYHLLYSSILAGELIKTINGLVPIDQIKIGDYLYAFDINNGLVQTTITQIRTSTTNKIYIIKLDNDNTLYALPNQQFYDPVACQWITTQKINACTILLDSQLKHRKCLRCDKLKIEPTKIYYLSTLKPHNFFVSKAEILTHNALPFVAVGLTWVFGTGIEFASTALFAGISWIGIQLHKKHKKSDIKVKIVPQAENDNSGKKEPKDPKKKKRDDAHKNHRPLTNKQARDQAKNLGYKRVKDHPCGNTRNQDVFTNGHNYISPDVDGHNGSFWKVFNSKGLIKYSMDYTLKKICKIYK